MLVSVRGAKDIKLTKMLKLAANSYADKLLSPQLSKNITVQVRIKERGQINAGGFCEMNEDTNVSPRCFNIDICRTKKKIIHRGKAHAKPAYCWTSTVATPTTAK